MMMMMMMMMMMVMMSGHEEVNFCHPPAVKDILDSVYVLTSANESGDGHADGRADL